MPTQREKFDKFHQMHDGPRAFVMPNSWDAGSTRLLSSLGFSALATTSAGYAFSRGKRDSFAALSRDEVIGNCSDIVEATALPVSADLENGFGHSPEDCVLTLRRAIEVGLVGGSIEDASGDPDAPIYEFDHAVDRIRASAEAMKGQPLLLTARAENYLWDRPDLGDTIRRLQAFGDAGADVLYAPGLRSLQDIATLCREVDKPVNVVMGLSGPAFTVADLDEVGVRRISVGGSFARAAFGAVRRAAEEVLGAGTFTYAADAIPDAELAQLMDQDKITQNR